MAGWVTNGLPLVSAITQNGAAVLNDQISNNATLSGGAPVTYTNVGAAARLSVDTETAAGSPPQSVAATAFQIAARAAELISNTATSTVHAATLNTAAGLITTEALTTAAGAAYTFTLTNSLISTANTPPSPAPQVQVFSGTNTAGAFQVTSITNGAGSSVFVITNTGTAAYNGTILIAFHI